MVRLSIDNLSAIYQDIIYIVALDGICFVFLVNKKVKYVKHSMKALEEMFVNLGFVRINYFSIINTKYYVRNNPSGGKEIIMKNGIILSVSRRKWPFFKLQNKSDEYPL